MDAFLARHRNTAFQFSGGRDSLAALYLLRPYWGRFTVYHLDGGDQFPETRAVVERTAAEVPIVILPGEVAASYRENGIPSDIVPSANTWLGVRVSGGIRLQDRYDCCFRAIMLPMYRRMKADRVTGIIRGVTSADFRDSPTAPGQWLDGFEFHYPLWGWSEERVMAYLEAEGVEPTPFYKHGLKTTPECMSCSAWWEDGRGAYLRRFHPVAFAKYQGGLRRIQQALRAQEGLLERELMEPERLYA